MVNKKNMRLWVAALRSGEFTQGRGSLKQATKGAPPQYCCLGVACEVALRNGVELLETHHTTPDEGWTVWSFDNANTYLPRSVSEWLAVTRRDDPMVGRIVRPEEPGEFKKAEEINAIYANDALGWTFEQIADGIEKFYELKEGEDGAE